MMLLIAYALLMVLILVSIGAGISAKVPIPTVIGQVVGLTAAFLQNLTKNGLTVYFFSSDCVSGSIQRLWPAGVLPCVLTDNSPATR